MRNAEWNKLRLAAAGMVVAAIIVGGTGLSCDENAQNMFRTTATPAVTTGVKTVVDGAVTDTGFQTIINGLIDGLSAAIQNAGDGSGHSGNAT